MIDDKNIMDMSTEIQSKEIEEYVKDQVFLSMDEFLQEVSGTQDNQNNENTDLAGEITEVHEISEVENWLGEINPNFDPYDAYDEYENNCGCCAYAVSERLDGKENISAGPDNIGTDEGMEAITGHNILETTPEEIELRLLEQEPGAHAIIGIDRVDGAGHWFNAYCPDGKNVYYVDGQDNTIRDWPPKDLGDISRWVMEIKEDR